MARGTAIWLLQNTKLNAQQVADFCGFHLLELNALKDSTLQPESPVLAGQLTETEIARCEADPSASLTLASSDEPQAKKEKKYTPLASRQDRPRGILWLVRNYPKLKDSQIARLLSTTNKTIQAIRDETHPLSGQLQPHNPALLNLCSEDELRKTLETCPPDES